MAKYIPLEIGIDLQASASDLHSFRWRAEKGIEADFFIPGDSEHLLRVSFDRNCIVRLLDEMPLSTENEDSDNEGLVREHFAYRIEGAVFDRSQSDIWKASVSIYGEPSHYRFVTGWTCVDVVTPAKPEFAIVADMNGHA